MAEPPNADAAEPLSLYLDVCCLNRPFDDQRQERIRLEPEAILAILIRLERRQWRWVSSTVIWFEIEQTPDLERRERVRLLAARAHTEITLTSAINERAERLTRIGLRPIDALHLACAEEAAVAVLLTTDRQFERSAARAGAAITVRVVNPLRWIEEVTN